MEDKKLPTELEVKLAKEAQEVERIEAGFCPKCETYLLHTSGCKYCIECGWSGCEM